jgi:dUTP pyrophosphatase
MANLTAQFKKTREDAVIPTRAHPSDVGYDLTAVAVEKNFVHGNMTAGIATWIYDTGIAVKPPDGYYFEIVARSSIYKTGWFLANGVGTIDPSYTGSIRIALNPIANFDIIQPPIPPFKICQLVLRPALYPILEEVEDLDDTERGEGGFGSTDKTE